MAQQAARSSGKPEIKDGSPKVSALLPCYNAAEFIGNTLRCLAEQTWPNLEILIADDCSTDDTLEIVRAFAKSRPNVRILDRGQNLGWLKNSNDLMAQATGEFLFFAFHDDIVSPNYVERLATALRDNPDAILAFSDLELFETGKQSRVMRFEKISGRTGTLRRAFLMANQADGWWVPNRGVFRARAFEDIGGIKPNAQGEYSADWTWLLHMSLLGQFVRVPEVLCFKYYQKQSLSKSWPRSLEQQSALLRAGIKEIEMSRVGRMQMMLIKAFILTHALKNRIRLRTRLRHLFSGSG